MASTEPFIYTYSGKRFPLYGDTHEVNIGDIAHPLSMQCRFTGHIREFYSVAQHSVWVSNHVRENGGTLEEAAIGLLHDASEAYLSDLAAPFKGEVKGYRPLEHVLHCRIMHRFGLPTAIPPIVKKWDFLACLVEARDFHFPGVWKSFTDVDNKVGDGEDTFKTMVEDCSKLTSMNPEQAATAFMEEYWWFLEEGVICLE